MSDFKHWESQVAGRLGISRDEIRRLRGERLQEGVDWALFKNRVLLAESGLEKIAAALRPGGPALDVLPAEVAEMCPVEKLAATAGIGAAQSMPEPVRLLVWKQTRNPRIIEAFQPESDPARRENILRVRVKNGANFCRVGGDGKPMALLARHVQADLYELAQALPKRKGKW